MKDYSCYSVLEAVELEALKRFADLIKVLDAKVVAKRLHAIVAGYGSGQNFIDTVCKFNSLGADVKTSVD